MTLSPRAKTGSDGGVRWWCPRCEKWRPNSVCDGKFDHQDATHQEAVRCWTKPKPDGGKTYA